MSDSSDKLAAMNSATLGVQMPVMTLPDGKKVQTGTFGALMINIKAYDALQADPSVPEGEKREQLASFDDKFKAALPLMAQVGFWEIFPSEDWVGAEAEKAGRKVSPGRKRVGQLVKEAGY